MQISGAQAETILVSYTPWHNTVFILRWLTAPRIVFANSVVAVGDWAESRFCWRLSMVEHNTRHKFSEIFGSSQELSFASMESSTAEDTLISLREPSLFKGLDSLIGLGRANSFEYDDTSVRAIEPSLSKYDCEPSISSLTDNTKSSRCSKLCFCFIFTIWWLQNISGIDSAGQVD